MKNNRCRYLSGILLETSLKSGLVCKFTSIWEGYAEPSPSLTCGNPQGNDECNIDSEFTYQWSWDHFQSICVETIPDSSFCSGMVLLTCLLVHCSAPLRTSCGPLPSGGISGRVCLRHCAHALLLPSHLTLTMSLKHISEVGIIRVSEDTEVWRVRTFPGAPPLVSDRAELPAEVCLSS